MDKSTVIVLCSAVFFGLMGACAAAVASSVLTYIDSTLLITIASGAGGGLGAEIGRLISRTHDYFDGQEQNNSKAKLKER